MKNGKLVTVNSSNPLPVGGKSVSKISIIYTTSRDTTSYALMMQ